MQVTYNIEEKDLFHLYKYILKKPKYFWGYLGNVLAAPILVLVVYRLLRIDWVYTMIWVIVTAFFMAFLLQYRVKRRIRKSLNQNAKGILGLHTIEISKDGFRETTDVNDSFHHWKGVKAIEDNAEYIFIYLNDLLGVHIIPKRDFPSPEQARQFYRLSIEYWKEAN